MCSNLCIHHSWHLPHAHSTLTVASATEHTLVVPPGGAYTIPPSDATMNPSSVTGSRVTSGGADQSASSARGSTENVRLEEDVCRAAGGAVVRLRVRCMNCGVRVSIYKREGVGGWWAWGDDVCDLPALSGPGAATSPCRRPAIRGWGRPRGYAQCVVGPSSWCSGDVCVSVWFQHGSSQSVVRVHRVASPASDAATFARCGSS